MATHLSFAGIPSDIGGRVPWPPTKVTCSVTISLQGNHDLPYRVTATFAVHRMDLVLHFGKEEASCLVLTISTLTPSAGK